MTKTPSRVRDWNGRELPLKATSEIDYNEYFLVAVEEFLGLLLWIEPPPTERQAEIDQIKLLVRRAANKIISEESLDQVQAKYLKLKHFHHRQSQVFYLKHVLGQTYEEIGNSFDPQISRQRVAQRVKKVESVLNLNVNELRRSVRKGNVDNYKRDLFAKWFSSFGRLPIESEIEPDKNCGLTTLVLSLNLARRILFYKEQSLPIPDAEYDLHYDQISGKYPFLERGKFWSIGGQDVLREYLVRRSNELGKPGKMPMIKELPRCVIVGCDRFGGINRVAKLFNLQTQGTLFGDDGRTYWTLERLIELVHKVNEYHSLPRNTLPSFLKVSCYISSGADEVLTKRNVQGAYYAWRNYLEELTEDFENESIA